MDVLRQCIQTRAYERRQGSNAFAWSSSMEINMSKGLVNLTFSYLSILTVSIYDGCLGIAAAMACWVGQQRPGKEARHFLDCMRAWAACVCGARTEWSFVWRLPALSHSFLLPFSLSFSLSLFFLFFYFFIPLPFFHLSFFQASQGWHLLKTRILLWMAGTWSVTLCDFPHTWTLCESQVCNVGVSFWVYFHSKEHQSVQLLQSLCSQASYVP